MGVSIYRVKEPEGVPKYWAYVTRLLGCDFTKRMGVSLCELRLQVLMLRNCGGDLCTKCPKHLNLKAEDCVCTKVDMKCVDNGKL